MPAVFILATTDTALADVWEGQLPAGRMAMRLPLQGFPPGNTPAVAAVIILDGASDWTVPPALARCPVVYVGEPGSLPFEQAKLGGQARVYLSYEESNSRLRDLLPLLEEVAEKQLLLEMLAEKGRRSETTARPSPRASIAESAEFWDFIEGAVESMDSRDRLLGEFRRASRHLLRASHAVFFNREAGWLPR